MSNLDETIRQLFVAETADAAAIFEGPRDRDTAVKLAMRMEQRAERTFLPIFQTVACKKGCGYCCRGVRVDVTAPEALTIARGFRETLPPEGVAMILERVRHHATLVRGMTLEERYRARTPCPLLDETADVCAVHEARPMRCRAHHSLNVEDCKAAHDHRDEPRKIDRYPDVMDAHEAMILGQKKSLVANHVDARPFELSLALEVALSHDDSAERWARGERLFDAAAFTWPDEETFEDSDLPQRLYGD